MTVAELGALLQSLPDDMDVVLVDNDIDDYLDVSRLCVTDLAYDRTDDDVHIEVLAIRLPGIQHSLDCVSIADYLNGKRPKRRAIE